MTVEHNFAASWILVLSTGRFLQKCRTLLDVAVVQNPCCDSVEGSYQDVTCGGGFVQLNKLLIIAIIVLLV
jgi:hypothetical protein